MKLKRSFDRKVTNKSDKSGKRAKLANTFGLPSGLLFSCPGATSVCTKICYAGKLEKIYKGTLAILLHNWGLLHKADLQTQIRLLSEMITDFIAECNKLGAEKLFRIHWDGDMFSEQYATAWAAVIASFPEVQFWCYTRSSFAVPILVGLKNLSLYFSTDSDNLQVAKQLHKVYNVRLAYLAQSFQAGQDGIGELIGQKAVKCPENNKKIPLIDTKGGACVSCGLCVHNRQNVLFSISKK